MFDLEYGLDPVIISDRVSVRVRVTLTLIERYFAVLLSAIQMNERNIKLI
jgi:hypothetical protein